MARGTRVDAPGAFQHVMVRGIEGREIFLDEVDRDHFLCCLRKVAMETGARLGAWALMTTHVHLLTRTGFAPLSVFMQRVGTRYVRHFNKRHERRGYLFQGRFKSLLVEDDAYLLVLIRYIHGNPLRPGLVGSLEELAIYPWTGHAALMGHRQEPLQLVNEILARFGSNADEARKHLVDWMSIGTKSAHHGMEFSEPPNLDGKLVIDGEPLHRDAQLIAPFDRAIAHLADLSIPKARLTAASTHFGSLDALIERVCVALDADPEQVRAGRRSAAESRARAAIASVARRQMGLPFKVIAAAVGVTIAALSQSESRGAVIASEAGFPSTRRDT